MKPLIFGTVCQTHTLPLAAERSKASLTGHACYTTNTQANISLIDVYIRDILKSTEI